MSSLAESNTSHNIIKDYLAVVRQLHVQCGHRMPSGDHLPRVAQVLRGIKVRKASEGDQGSRQPRLPITSETLWQIKATWEKDHINKDKVMLWAAFTLCFFSFMRSENYAVLPVEHSTNREISLHMTFQLTMPETLKP